MEEAWYHFHLIKILYHSLIWWITSIQFSNLFLTALSIFHLESIIELALSPRYCRFEEERWLSSSMCPMRSPKWMMAHTIYVSHFTTRRILLLSSKTIYFIHNTIITSKWKNITINRGGLKCRTSLDMKLYRMKFTLVLSFITYKFILNKSFLKITMF